ncbi:MAG: prepilin-type N-terminal cleavage/methylation domain-containing protein [Halioglobus sp.]|nr:prepilin-type N-terminal cleavage/methylation domain-containing protein [Halioglobus sp.]
MRNRGFTLLEVMIALAIVGLLAAVSVPAGARFYASMQYRAAVADLVAVLSSARHKAVRDGAVRDVTINPRTKEVSLQGAVTRLPADLGLSISSGAALNTADSGVIRFYPEGGSSGGEISLVLPGRAGVRVVVDWLIGGITQEDYALN